VTTAKELIAALQRHHTPPPSKPIGGRLLVEVQSPTGGRRADALWVPVNTAMRGQLVGYEVKVSRSDVLQELRDPMKADAWERHCSQWWLVVPNAGLLQGLDVPERWGVMLPPRNPNGRSMTVVKQAQQQPATTDPAAWGEVLAKLIYGGDDIQAALLLAQRDAELAEKRRLQTYQEVLELRAAGRLTGSERERGQEKVREVLTELGKLTEDGAAFEHSWSWNISAERIARQLLAAQEEQRELGYILSDADRMERSAAALTRAAAELRVAAEGVPQRD
jgi:hypothetical protein